MKPKADLEELRRRIASIEATPPSAASGAPLDPSARARQATPQRDEPPGAPVARDVKSETRRSLRSAATLLDPSDLSAPPGVLPGERYFEPDKPRSRARRRRAEDATGGGEPSARRRTSRRDDAPADGAEAPRRRDASSGDEDAPRKRTREPDPQKLTEDALREAALAYLDKYDASVNQLRRVLRRRIDKYGDDDTKEPARRRIDELLERFVASRLLDDTRFTQGFVESARRRGASSLKIKSKLRARGVAPELVSTSLDAVQGGGGPSELDAALTFARKRRLHKKFDLGAPAERQKALASLARQGFSFDVARKALELVVQSEEDDGAVF